MNLKKRALSGVLALGLLMTVSCAHGPAPQRLRKVEIELGGRKIAVEIARTPKELETGMMFRRSLEPDEGMLFFFPHSKDMAFYMKNTYVALSIAFIRSDGVIANIAHMEPETLTPHFARVTCHFALEMPQGWFAKNGVAEGARVALPELSAE